MKQHYPRTYPAGRSTAGWDKGERISNLEQVKPGDVLIMVSRQFQAENLIRVTVVGSRGFDYEYTDNETGAKSGREAMFCWDWELLTREYFRAIDRRKE